MQSTTERRRLCGAFVAPCGGACLLVFHNSQQRHEGRFSLEWPDSKVFVTASQRRVHAPLQAPHRALLAASEGSYATPSLWAPALSRFCGPLVASSLVGARLVYARRWKARRNQKQVERRFFDMEKMNPFYEAPAQQTQKKYADRVNAINNLAEKFKAMSDEELRAFTADLKEKASGGTDLDSLLPEAFAIVREASDRVLGLRHFDVQMMGGIALHTGNIAEMGTGEGKTLVAILPAFLNALTGKGVHVVTVNDYLARRDAEWVGQPLRFLGLTVGIIQGGMQPEQRQKAYRCDVTYVTNSELGFDYLRDQMAPTPSDLCLREREPFQFAIVDEVDSILIDEARTPLIISGTASNPSKKYEVAREVARTLKRTIHYTVDEKQKNCVLIEGGVGAAEELLGKDDLFDPADPWFPFIINALNAKELYVKDKSYIVRKGEVMIVDEFTGRVMDGRRWSNGLHQAVEAKEGVEIQAESVTLASISYQSLFRLFKKLSGMTGTAFTEAKEFTEIYKLKTVVVPPNRDRRREDKDDQVYVDDIGKWKAVARDIDNAHRIGRPVLIGTTNVENSEIVAELLDTLDVPYQLLNAKPENVAKETEIIAGSGRKYAVTIATNMAGRGTDILLGGNSTMMARLKLREALYAEIFPKKKKVVTMPDDFYPIDLSKEASSMIKNAVRTAASQWTTNESEKPSSLDAAERILENELTELEVEERLSLACEKAPITDDVLLGLRKTYNRIAAEFKEIADLEKAEVVALGGLYVIGTERHESRRIDNQLRGRGARQGDPGATRFFLSLNDSIFRIFGGDQIKKMMNMMSFTSSDDTPLESGLLSQSLEEAQKKVENYFYSVRKNVFDYDDVMDTQRQIVYTLRRRALLDTDESLLETMREFSDRNMEDFVNGHVNPQKDIKEWNLDKLAENVGLFCELLKETITEDKLKKIAEDEGFEGIARFMRSEGQVALDKKCSMIEEVGPRLTGLVSRQILLMQLDNFWQQHLKNMDFLKTGVTLRAYGQKNPLVEYKLEGYQVFLKMMSRIRRNALYNLFLFTPRKLKPMSEERIKGLIPNREQRRAQMKEVLSTGSGRINAASSINFARLALSVRQLLEARESLGELSLASFGELKEAFGRAGLLTLGDQLRWATACTDFELKEDELTQDIYICMKGGAEPAPMKTEALTEEESREQAALREQQRAQQVLASAMDNKEFQSTVSQYLQAPEFFLDRMKEATAEQGWGEEDAQQMRAMYKASGVDIDELLKQMSAQADDLPPEQRQVVEYMQALLDKADGKDVVPQEEQSKSKVQA